MKIRNQKVGKAIPVYLSREDIRKAKRAIKAGSDRCDVCPVSQAVKKTIGKNVFTTHTSICLSGCYVSGYLLPRSVTQKIINKFDKDKEVKPQWFNIYPVA